MHREAIASRRRHDEPAASENAAARTSAAAQPSAEAALVRAAVSGEQSEGRVEGRRARAPTNEARAPWATPRASRSERELLPAWRAGGERERRRADERSESAERRGGADSPPGSSEQLAARQLPPVCRILSDDGGGGGCRSARGGADHAAVPASGVTGVTHPCTTGPLTPAPSPRSPMHQRALPARAHAMHAVPGLPSVTRILQSRVTRILQSTRVRS